MVSHRDQKVFLILELYNPCFVNPLSVIDTYAVCYKSNETEFFEM